MPNGQKCSLLKTLSEFIIRFSLFLPFLLFSGAAASQTPKIPLNRTFQIENPLKHCWNYPNGNIEDGKIASDNENLFLPLNNGKLISFNSRIGLPNWETDLGGQIKTPPDLLGNSLFIISKTTDDADKPSENYIVRRLNKETGVAIWQTKLFINESLNQSNTDIEIYLHSVENNLLIAASDGSFYLFDSAVGNIIESKTFQATLSTEPFFDGRQIVFGTSDGRIVSLLMNDLTKISEFKVPSAPTAVFKNGKNFIWGDAKGKITSSESRRGSFGKSGNRWKLRAGGRILSITPTLQEDRLLIASLDNYIYSVSASSGKTIWKKRLSDRPAFRPLVIDGYAVFETVGNSTALIIETYTGRTVNKISLTGETFFTGSPAILSPYIVFPSAAGLFSYTSEKTCP